ncbi:hypothetical protein HPP92_014107 [Vanilla planifolia]|uniref:Gnk2-homologous domain-containing protein n=1 Tax=Vanilla planifolia TaxID=51239 RepID=A0A835UZ90_VANPL|nr:hypothetical protein HPP92_014107 [Vanilla planifolia]
MPLPDIAQTASVSLSTKATVNESGGWDELQRLMADILPKASSSQSRFAVGKRMMEEQQNIYGLAWCSMDLTITDCLNCLSSVQDWL